MPDRSERGEGLGQHAARGFMWLFANSAASHAVQFLSQIVLAWLLSPEDFGLIALALTVTTLASVVERAGISEILVQRQRDFDKWLTPAFWLALTMGLASAVILAAFAPVAAAMYSEPRLTRLILVLALASPFAAMQCITRAVFLRDLQFRMLAFGGLAQATAQAVLTVLFATLGLGVYSFVLPRPVIAVVGLAIQWRLARPRITDGPRPADWKPLLADSSRMLVANFVMILNAQGDYILLGLLQPAAVVGFYYFAFRLSTQAVTLFTGNVTSVLFPTLTRLQHDGQRQTQAYLASARLLAVVGAPIALLQAAAADPLVRLLFTDKWNASIPFLQILSVGMVFRMAGSAAAGLLQAQGRFRTRMMLSLLYCVLFFPMALIGYWIAGATGLAWGVAAYYMTTGLIHPRIVINSTGGRWPDIVRIFLVPVTSAAVAVALSWIIARTFVQPGEYLATLAILLGGTVFFYVCELRLLAPDSLNAIALNIRRIVPGKVQPRNL